jgi:hypothetical protein
MVGDEEVHGPARVGGASVTYKKHKQHSQNDPNGDSDNDEEVQRGNTAVNNGELHKKQ